MTLQSRITAFVQAVGADIKALQQRGGEDRASIALVAYADRATLRSGTPAASELALVDGLGLFRFAAGSDEPDDDESCFATGAGRWLLMCPSWDVVNDWQLPDDDVRDAWDEDELQRFNARFAGRVLHGTATCAIVSLSPQTSVAFTGTVAGAAPGDRVIATPPAALGSNDGDSALLSYHAYVSAPNTVTVRLCCPYYGAATNPAVRTAWPITVIKGV